VLPLTPVLAQLQSAVRRSYPRTCRPATYKPGDGPSSEHATDYPGAATRLGLLHDFPDPGRFHRAAIGRHAEAVTTWAAEAALSRHEGL
jgi:hypothetical protein